VDTFAFIIHPIHVKRDVMRKYPFWGRIFSERQIEFLSTLFPPVYISHIEGIQSSATSKTVEGWFVACPLSPALMLRLPEKKVYKKIIQTGRMAEELGAQILGLGAFTSVVGDAGITVSKALDIPVTTGDAYTVANAIQAMQQAARLMDIPLESASAAVVGATGAIGSVCAQLLAQEVAELTLIGKQKGSLESVQSMIQGQNPRASIAIDTGLGGLTRAQLILTVTSDIHAVIYPEHLRPGCVVCDVARPRDVSTRVAAVRKDVLVIDGGIVEVPGDVNFNFDFGFPPGKAYACMAETMALALEGRFEDYTLGKRIDLARVKEIEEIAERHGFRLSGLRSFEQEVTPKHIDLVRKMAHESAQK
jgi:predicted amino acid dehydrogenase